MENLSRENFWNDLEKKYPLGMKQFITWVLEYHDNNKLTRLFNYGSPHYAKQGWHNPTFHDLPLAFQRGLWMEFICSRGGCQYEIADVFTHDWREDITNYIKMMHEDELGSTDKLSKNQ